MYGGAYRFFLSHLDPESAHRAGLSALRTARRIPGGMAMLRGRFPDPDERLQIHLWGSTFSHPLGVAAGLDKDGEAVEALLALGFSYVEVGTVTLRPQKGNVHPRIWRYPAEGALVNAMGFPSHGVDTLSARLLRLKPECPIGINIGKNRDVPLERAADDYCAVVQELPNRGLYLVVNVSSPNTPGLRSLQQPERLAALVAQVRSADSLQRPLLVKLSPDLDDAEAAEIAQAVVEAEASGIIATNTTTRRDGLPPEASERPGGASGAPLRDRARAVLRVLYRAVGHRVPIISVGGVHSADEVVDRVKAGASLVQAYTGFIYAGPRFPAHIVAGLRRIADDEGWTSIQSLVGVEASRAA